MLKSTRSVLVAIFFIFPIYILIQLFVPVYDSDKPLEIEIPQGATYKSAIDILAENKLIRDKFLFRALGKITGVDRKMRAVITISGAGSHPSMFSSNEKRQNHRV